MLDPGEPQAAASSHLNSRHPHGRGSVAGTAFLSALLIALGAPFVGTARAGAALLDCAARNPIPADLANELAARYPACGRAGSR
jgi:hypothetical protein